MLLDGEELIDNWTSQTRGDSFYSWGSTEKRAKVDLEAGRPYELCIEYRRDPVHFMAGLRFGILRPVPADLIERAARAASQADAAIVVVGTNGEWETEGNDRRTLDLPGRQRELIEAVCAANPRSVVVVNASSPVETGWLEHAPAALQTWFPGQEFGNALVDVIFGDVNPSGRLPCTFPVRLEDTPAFTTYPGADHKVLYGEDLFVGYRWYDMRDLEPRLPFGHGLSYTRFAYGNLSVASECRRGEQITVRLEVANTGERAGQEVVQLYVRDLESRLIRPPKELKAFRKIELAPGERTRVELMLDERSLAYWDPEAHAWVAEPGEFEILVGASSRDIHCRARFTLV
jgi:beta-glucosidase